MLRKVEHSGKAFARKFIGLDDLFCLNQGIEILDLLLELQDISSLQIGPENVELGFSNQWDSQLFGPKHGTSTFVGQDRNQAEPRICIRYGPRARIHIASTGLGLATAWTELFGFPGHPFCYRPFGCVAWSRSKLIGSHAHGHCIILPLETMTAASSRSSENDSPLKMKRPVTTGTSCKASLSFHAIEGIPRSLDRSSLAGSP